uniref:Uncharacterized protein n=1 Tax=Caulobacter sp. (strain K31) TaxID=366602 RepID=B0T6I0_CAUSK
MPVAACWGGEMRGHWKLAIGGLIAFSLSILAQAPAGAEEAMVRTSADGAGPSHLFWLTGPSAGQPGDDIVGVVDPLFAAVRFYSVRRATLDGEPLGSRLKPLGACGLPIDLRPWRVHQTKAGVMIETMPNPGVAGFQAKAAALLSRYYLISRTIADSGLAAEADLKSVNWDPGAAKSCGAYDGVPKALRARQPYAAARGAKFPARTIILTNGPQALTSRDSLIVRSPKDGLYRLTSARELEPSGTRRVVQITEVLPSSDGMLRLRQSILTYLDGQVVASRRFDETLLRSKLGQKPIAVTPVGELLVMGLIADGQGKKMFAIVSCGQIDKPVRPGDLSACRDGEAYTTRNISDETPVAGPPAFTQPAGVPAGETQLKNARALFDLTEDVRTVTWRADASKLRVDCRSATGCPVQGETYVAIRGLRLTRGPYEQTGMAYAQTEDPRATLDGFLQVSRAGGWDARLSNLDAAGVKTPGNLKDGFGPDLGIDCSALVQLAWGAIASSARLSTEGLQKAPPGYVCPDRLPNADWLKSGDAIGINTANGPHHVVLLGAAFMLDGASSGWLVLESASGCDGVCWSVYDPSFFNGWGLYRASKRSDLKCPPASLATGIPSHPIPTLDDAWRAAVGDASAWPSP